MSDDSPYDRVTNPERFGSLHDAARAVVAEATRDLDVAVERVEPDGAQLTGGVLGAVRLAPSNSGAPVTITFTGFPGLHVRFGIMHTQTFPQCGCDACDEQPDQLEEDLRQKMLAVAQGRFSEPPGGYEFIFDDGSESGGHAVRHLGRTKPTRQYEPWPRRGPV